MRVCFLYIVNLVDLVFLGLPDIEEAPEHLLEPTFHSCPSICTYMSKQGARQWLDFDKDLNARMLSLLTYLPPSPL